LCHKGNKFFDSFDKQIAIFSLKLNLMENRCALLFDYLSLQRNIIKTTDL